MNPPQDWEFEEPLRESLGTPPQADFDSWQARHKEDVAYLNPVVTQTYRNRRRWMMRITSAAAGVVILLSIGSMFFSQQASFAQAFEAIDKAKTITWTWTTYARFSSEDGERTWLGTEPRMEIAFQSPNLYRDTRYDREGNVRWVEIVDAASNKALHLDLKKKKATWLNEPTNQYGLDGPFSGVKNILKSKPLELVGQRELNGKMMNVFRYRRDTKGIPDHTRTMDIWLDAKTKELVRIYDPGADFFDPETHPERNNPAEEKILKGQMMGSMQGDIVLDAELDPKLFSMTIPEGFKVVSEPPKPIVTEADMIEWLDATAQVNNDVFMDSIVWYQTKRVQEALQKEVADRNEEEAKLGKIWHRHFLKGNSPLWSYIENVAVSGSFRYLGKGVKLGDAGRIVMYYKLKSSGIYRAVYGDLTVKDVEPEDLPLPVEENPRN